MGRINIPEEADGIQEVGGLFLMCWFHKKLQRSDRFFRFIICGNTVFGVKKSKIHFAAHLFTKTVKMSMWLVDLNFSCFIMKITKDL